MLKMAGITASLALLAATGIGAQDRYTVKVPNGLAFSEFRDYQGWQFVSMSQNGPLQAIILGNSVTIEAFKSGIPDNGKPFPDGAKIAKIHWVPKTNTAAPGQPLVPNVLHDVDFMVKDSKRFGDSNGWGYGAFEYDAATDSFSPGTLTNTPPQGHDAKCGAACHTAAQNTDYVFTHYPKR